MKSLFWQKIPDYQAPDTLWKSLDDSSVKLNLELLLSSFAAKPPPAPKKPSIIVEAAPPKPKFVEILDSNRSRSLNIMLSRFKIPYPDIAAAIKQLRNIFTDDQLSAIRTNQPTPEEIAQVKAYDGEYELLGNPEKFVLALSTVDELSLHISFMFLMKTFSDKIKDIKNPLSSILKTLEQIKDSKSLKKVLTYVLAIGNYLNGGTSRGGAYGFKINLLGEMNDIKGQVASVTLMHILVNQILDNDPSLTDFENEFIMIDEAIKLELDFLKGEFKSLQGTFNLCNQYLKKAEQNVVEGDLFYPKFVEFEKDNTPSLDDAQTLFDNIETTFNQSLQLYGEAPGSYNLIDFIKVFKSFFKGYTTIKQEILKKKAKEQKEAEKNSLKTLKSKMDEEGKQRGFLDGVIKVLNEMDTPEALSSIEEDTQKKSRSVRSARIQMLIKKQ